MTRVLKVGVVGTSRWADLMHLPSLTSHPNAEVTAICGRSKQPAESMAAKYGISTVYSDFADLIEDPRLDAVVIASPDDTHYEISMRALERDLHVLCEKPLANRLDEAEAMATAATKAGVTHMTLFTWRWVPVFSRLKSEIDSCTIGKPVAARLSFMMNGAFEPGYRWRSDASRCNGTLGDLGAHLIDLTRWTLGDIASVSATVGTLINRNGQEAAPGNDHAVLDLMTHTGVHASLLASNVAMLGDELGRIEVQVFGNEGSLDGRLVFFGSGAGSTLVRSKSVTQPREVIQSSTFRSNVEPPDLLEIFRTASAGPRAFVEAALAQRQVEPNLRDGLAVQRVIDAALRSSEAGCRVDL